MLRPLPAFLFLLTLLSTVRGIAQSDGTYDPTFIQGTGFASNVQAIARQADGKLLLGGDQLGLYNGAAVRDVLRLGADGALDASFNVGDGPDSHVLKIVLQPDGRILVGGVFSNFNGVSARRLVRLMSNGAVDAGFSIGTGANGWVTCVAVQPDGKILVGGRFSQWDGTAAGGIVRLLADGSVDPEFNVGTGADDNVNVILLRPSGKILVGGNFDFFNGTARHLLAQLNADGTLDLEFDPGPGGAPDDKIRAMALLPDGKLLCGGDLETWQGIPVLAMVRLETDGSRDALFNSDASTYFGIIDIALQPDGKVLICGTMGLERFTEFGVVDPTFDTGTSFQGGFQVVQAMLQLPDGRLLAGGIFSEYNGNAVGNIVRLTRGDVGIHEAAKLQVAAWPNPTDGPLTIQWSNSDPVWITVRDLAGRTVLEHGPLRSGVELSLDDVPGVYHVEVRNASGVQRFPVVKQ